MDKTIDFQQRSKKYRTKYLDGLSKLYGTAMEPRQIPKFDQGATIYDRSHSEWGNQENLTTAKFKPRKQHNDTPMEEHEQICLSAWLKKQGIKHTASANGGKRSPAAGRKLKRMGVSRGFPDIEIPMPSGRYQGLYIELKRQRGSRVEPEQREWLDYLNSIGKCAKVAYGFEEAKAIVLEYLALTRPAA